MLSIESVDAMNEVEMKKALSEFEQRKRLGELYAEFKFQGAAEDLTMVRLLLENDANAARW